MCIDGKFIGLMIIFVIGVVCLNALGFIPESDIYNAGYQDGINDYSTTYKMIKGVHCHGYSLEMSEYVMGYEAGQSDLRKNNTKSKDDANKAILERVTFYNNTTVKV